MDISKPLKYGEMVEIVVKGETKLFKVLNDFKLTKVLGDYAELRLKEGGGLKGDLSEGLSEYLLSKNLIRRCNTVKIDVSAKTVKESYMEERLLQPDRTISAIESTIANLFLSCFTPSGASWNILPKEWCKDSIKCTIETTTYTGQIELGFSIVGGTLPVVSDYPTISDMIAKSVEEKYNDVHVVGFTGPTETELELAKIMDGLTC